MVRGRFIPARGDVIWLNFDPRIGKEQAGHRPALVLSDQSYNKLVGLAVVCPITSHVKGYPFEVPLNGKKVSGCVLADHVKNVDWRERKASFAETASDEVVTEALARLAALLFPP
jgi:mRNA interferase MazF